MAIASLSLAVSGELVAEHILSQEIHFGKSSEKLMLLLLVIKTEDAV